MGIHVARLALHALVQKAIEQRATVVAKRGAGVSVHEELVSAKAIRVGALVRARAREADIFVATAMNRETAYLTLKALLAKAPDKVLAVATEGGLRFQLAGVLVLIGRLSVEALLTCLKKRGTNLWPFTSKTFCTKFQTNCTRYAQLHTGGH